MTMGESTSLVVGNTNRNTKIGNNSPQQGYKSCWERFERHDMAEVGKSPMTLGGTIFQGLKEAVDKTGVGLASAAQKVSKGVATVREKLEQEHENLVNPGLRWGPLYEPPENVKNCRCCQTQFKALKNRKVNCSECAGVFCVECTHLDISTDKGGGSNAESTQGSKADKKTRKEGKADGEVRSSILNGASRICDGCKRGETPGEDIRNAIRKQLETQLSRLEKKDRKKVAKNREVGRSQFEDSLDLASMSLAVKVADSVGAQTFVDSTCLPVRLTRGAPYDENDNGPDEAPPPPPFESCPSSGYLQVTNKSPVFFCIKVLYAGGEVKFEVPRPSYIAVPPGGTVHAFFDGDGDGEGDGDNDDDKAALQIMILFDNPKEEKGLKKKKDKPIVYKTNRHVDTDKISSCARVSMFRSASVFEVSTKDKNVVLK